jgi:DNA polymerase
MEGLLDIEEPISSVRGKIHYFRGTKAIVTYHPSFLLISKNQISDKRKVWEDMLLAMESLKMKVTDKQRAYFS